MLLARTRSCVALSFSRACARERRSAWQQPRVLRGFRHQAAGPPMRDDDVRIGPGGLRSTREPRMKSFLAQVLAAAQPAHSL